MPKKHYENLNDNPDPELLGHLLSVVPEIAKIKGVYDSGYRVNINTGEDSASTVPHLHLHIMGGIKMGRATFEESFLSLIHISSAKSYRICNRAVSCTTECCVLSFANARTAFP